MQHKLTRRDFMAAAAAAGIASSLNTPSARAAATPVAKPALLGGKPVRTTPFPSWPVFDEQDEQALLNVFRSGKWFRGYGQNVDNFELAWAKATGAKHCIAVANGTSSLIVSLIGVGVEAGDEVIVPPYTFVATVNAVLMLDALPVFVDSDPNTFQIDAKKIESAITDRTRAIMPVHLGGNVADMDTIMEVARRRKIPVVEDACQAHFAEWRGKKAATVGDCGGFSFQASKNLNSGEGGAILTNSDELADRCYPIHTNGRTRNSWWPASARTANFRMTEFQAGLLMSQMTRLEEQSRTREQNAQYLSRMLSEVPGIAPAKMYEGCTRNAYHLYMFRYDPAQFAGLSRGRFIQALGAEGIPAGGGYTPLNREAYIRNTLQSRGFKALFSPQRLKQWEEQNQCPQNDRLCTQAVWLVQTQLLGPRSDMDQVAEAVRKIHAHAGDLAKG